MRIPRTASLCLTLLILTVPLFAQPPAPPERPELRGMWVDGFNDGFKTPAQCDTLLARLRAAHCNAVFVQMRKRADAYYHSHYEGWAQDDPQHFDALQYLCDKGHAKGKPPIQIHAWINACAIGGNPSAGALTKLHPEWLSLSDTGADFDTEATKIDPGNPQGADWTYRVYMDVVRQYPVDGIHLDFIRYGGDSKTVGHWGYNAVSVARYDAQYGTTGSPMWNDTRWSAWRREQVTALVRRISIGAHALKPKLIVSAATICWGKAPESETDYEATSASYTEVFAPWRDWMHEGLLDLNCPMTYFNRPKAGEKWAGWIQFAKNHQFGHQSALGVGLYLNAVPDSLTMLRETRQATASGNTSAGVVMYCYDTMRGEKGQEVEGDTTLLAALQNVYKRDVQPPAMPWKIAPTTGALRGNLLSGDNLIAADGALVTVERIDGGVSRKALSDGNGTFGFVGLPPGSYIVTANFANHEEKSGVRILPGHVSQVTILQPGESDSVARVTGIGGRADGDPVVLGAVLVTSGSDPADGHFYAADGFGQPVIRVEAPNLVPPAVAGDRVVISGTLRHTMEGIVLKADAVRLVGME